MGTIDTTNSYWDIRGKYGHETLSWQPPHIAQERGGFFRCKHCTGVNVLGGLQHDKKCPLLGGKDATN